MDFRTLLQVCQTRFHLGDNYSNVAADDVDDHDDHDDADDHDNVASDHDDTHQGQC